MPKKPIQEAGNPHFGMVWDPKTGRYFPTVGKGKEGGMNKGRFKGPYGLAHKKNLNFTNEKVDKLIDRALATDVSLTEANPSVAKGKVNDAVKAVKSCADALDKMDDALSSLGDEIDYKGKDANLVDDVVDSLQQIRDSLLPGLLRQLKNIR